MSMSLTGAKNMTPIEFDNTFAKTHNIINPIVFTVPDSDLFTPQLKIKIKVNEMTGYFSKYPTSYDYLCDDKLKICVKNNRCVNDYIDAQGNMRDIFYKYNECLKVVKVGFI